MRSLAFPLLLGALAFQAVPAAQAQTQLLYLAEDVPVALDPDGPSSTVNTSQVGRINMMEPLIGYAMKGMNDDGIRIPDFTKFEGRLAESWDYDPATSTVTHHVRGALIPAEVGMRYVQTVTIEDGRLVLTNRSGDPGRETLRRKVWERAAP